MSKDTQCNIGRGYDMHLKKTLGIVCAAAIGAVGIGASVQAATCTSAFSTSWNTTVKCAAPNAGKGQSTGNGTVGGASQTVTAKLLVDTPGGSADKATASGHLPNNNIAVGQFNSCLITDPAPANATGATTVGLACIDFPSGTAAVKHRVQNTF